MKIFEKADYKTEEGYQVYVWRKLLISIGLLLISIVTMIVTGVAKSKGLFHDDFMMGVYEGVGVGLFAASIALLVRNIRRLTNKEVARKSRIEMNDERNLEIYRKAICMATFVVLIVSYLIMLIGGLLYPILTKVMCSLVCLFLAVYVIAYKVYQKQC